MADYEAGTMKGTVVKFIQDKRGEFGFIQPDDGGANIFFHATIVWGYDIELTPKPGDRIEFDFQTVTHGRNKGSRRATKVLAYEINSEAAAEICTGVLKKFWQARGYGFIAAHDGGKDIFLHRSAVDASLGTAAEVPVGATVEFQMGLDPKGRPQVTEFTVLKPAPAGKRSRKRKSVDAPIAAE
jgi:CspA family cold shock protein